MARIRTVKPSFFTSLTIASLPIEARLTFVGLWTHCDDEGRCVDDTRLIKAALWPLDERTPEEIGRDLGALHEASLIVRYEVRGRRYLAVRTWAEHQRISHPTASELPGPDDDAATVLTCTLEDSGSLPGILTEPSVNVPGGKGREGKGREQGKEITLAPATPTPRKRDDLWDSLMAACGVDSREIPSSARGAYNAAAKSLREIGATPDEIHARAATFRRTWPTVSLTPTALARRWAELTDRPPASRGDARIAGTLALAARYEEAGR